ncbi:Ionotropic receptor 93a-like 16, partial [Homarus americanus]
MLTTLVLTRSYAGNLMSLLAVRHIPQPYQSLRDVLDDPSVTMIWEANTKYVKYFRSVESGIFSEVAESEKRGLVKYTTPSHFVIDTDTLVRRGDHVFISEVLTIEVIMNYYFSQVGRCDFYWSKESFLVTIYALIAQKDSPIITAFNARMRQILDYGLLDQWYYTILRNSTACTHAPDKITISTSISLNNIWV